MKQFVGYIIALLVVLMGCTTDAERTRMRTELDSINQRNRNDQPFTVQDVEPYVSFFDQYGTANDRLLAHYLLGRAFYEQGEAPMALQCYHDAVECADTLSSDCDYAQLARVYGQMAEIFYYQGLYRKLLDYDRLSIKYAWKGLDTLLALRNYEQTFFAYKELNDLDSAIIVIEDVAQKYKQYGKPINLAISLGLAIKPLIAKGDLNKAKSYIDIYETQSGRFDSLGNIEKGREIYYRTKGLYFMGINKLDSAEYYFRKELCIGKSCNNQHSAALGLAELYSVRQISDSTAKYYKYAYAMSDSIYARRTTKEVERIQAMYNYSRHQLLAHKESEKASSANRKLLISLIALLAVLLLSTWLYIARKKMKENLEKAAIELDEIRTENITLKQDASANKSQISENEIRIKHLENKLGKYGKLVYFGAERAENDLKNSPNYQQIAKKVHKGQQLTQDDWSIIGDLIKEYLPGFNDFIATNLMNGSMGYHVCLLLRLHFKAVGIANILNVTPAYISKISTEILATFFDKKGSSKELYKELREIN